MVDLTPLEHARNLPDEIADVLRRHILSGQYQSGQKMVQADVARQLGVSRGPVREALKLLAAEGLVRDEPRRGTFVTAPTVDDVRDVYDLRVGIEVRAAQLILMRSRIDLEPLHELLRRMRAAARRGHAKTVVRHDFAFHETLCRLSGNDRLHAVFVGHAAALRSLLRLDELTYGSLDELVAEHEALLARLDAGDEGGAVALLRAHIEEAGARLVAHMSGA